MNTTTNRASAYETITQRIIDALEGGVIPWRKTWRGSEAPVNAISMKRYNGINYFLLSIAAMNYSDNRWLTYKQAKGLGGNVRKGEHGMTIVYWSFIDDKSKERDEDGHYPQRAFMRTYTVFNVEQCEGLVKLAARTIQPIVHPVPDEAAEAIVRGYSNPPTINIRYSGSAYYRPSIDTIVVPEPSQYTSINEYYATLFHEMTHSTGHESRLNRLDSDNVPAFGSEIYSKEELIAELGSAFLCAEAGIDNTLDNSVAYIQSWLGVLRNDPKLVITAASKAQKAADHILGRETN